MTDSWKTLAPLDRPGTALVPGSASRLRPGSRFLGLGLSVCLSLAGCPGPGSGPVHAATPAGAPEEASRGDRPAPGGMMSMDLEQLTSVPLGNVYGASKTKQKSGRAPSTVTVITSADIRRYGYRTLADIIRSLRGFYVSYDRNYFYVGVRGFGRPADYNSRVLILVDGHRLNDPIYGAAYVGTDGLLDVDLIDRLEAIRGPSSSLYGTGAFFGIINIITREGSNMKARELSVEAGDLGYRRGRLTVGHQEPDGTAVMASVTDYQSEGNPTLFYPEFDNPLDNMGRAVGVDGGESWNQFFKLFHRGVTLEAAKNRRRKEIPTGSFSTVFNARDNRTADTLEYIHLRYEHVFPHDLSVMGRIYRTESSYEGTYTYDNGGVHNPADYVVNKDQSFGDWWGGELQFTKRFSPTSQLILGGEYQNNRHVDQINFDVNPFFLRMSELHGYNLYGVYLEGERELFKNVSLSAGVRHDVFSTFGHTTNPRIAIITKPREPSVFKLLYGTAFRAPNFFEIFYQDNGNSQKGNSDLKPETITTYEGVWEEQINEFLRGTAAYYYYQMQDQVDSSVDPADGLLHFTNQDPLDAKGLELELSGRWPNAWEGRASYALQKARNRVTGDVLSNSAQQMAKLNLIIPLARRKVYLGLEEQFVSARTTVVPGEAEPVYLTNLTLSSSKLLDNADLSASVYNLFDRRYADPGGTEHLMALIPQEGRLYRVKVVSRF